MRIYSKFHDYYDPALRDFELEATPVYKRETITIPMEKSISVEHVRNTRHYYHDEKRLLVVNDNDAWIWETTAEEDRKHLSNSKQINLSVLGFCGKMYCFYSSNPTNGGLISFYRVNNPEYFMVTKKSAYHRKSNQEVEILDGYDGIENCSYLKSIFVKHDCPVFLWDFGKDIVLNPVLKDIGFQKVMTPYEAIQEINMFLNNDLVKDNCPPMPVGSDKVIAESKGFDKWSFRKMPIT